MSKEIKEILVCNSCEKPIFFTFVFIGSEYYCPSCGSSGDIFFGKRIESTPKLLKLRRSLAIKWGQVKNHLFMGGERMNDCKKCKDESHIRHLTRKETKKMYWARERLDKIMVN